MKTVLSLIQPTGDVHFGNYFGAIQNWVRLQEQYRCYFGVADFHAITMPFNPGKLRQNTWEIALNLVALGVKPDSLFIQSLIPEHAELGWILNCFASYGQLTRMTQFKDKSQQSSSQSGEGFISVGLFDYPVLQAADILIYRADYVPVGKDQEQHLELTRNIASRFNNQLKTDFLVVPEGLYTELPKVQSTADPLRKMSKSAGEKHYINVFGDEARIHKQIKSAVTDTGTTPVGEVSPGVDNLLSLLRAAGQAERADQLLAEAKDNTLRYSDLKEETADALVSLSARFKARKNEVLADKKNIKEQLRASSAEIRKVARETLREVKQLTGLLNPKYPR